MKNPEKSENSEKYMVMENRLYLENGGSDRENNGNLCPNIRAKYIYGKSGKAGKFGRFLSHGKPPLSWKRHVGSER